MYRQYLIGGAAAIALATAFTPALVLAQETTSSIRGVVTGPEGGPAAGITVRIVHEPTKSVTTTTTNAAGGFGAQGLRIGGPYTIIFQSGSYQDARLEGVFLSLGETETVNASLQPASGPAATADEILVIGDAGSIAQIALGPSSTLDISDLENLPSINRDLRDVIRSDPRIFVDDTFVDAVQCAGLNPRFNSLTVDGIRKNDGFGLNSNGYPTERQPFPFDAVEQVAVELAPFSVEYGGFSACNINAVTKSGSNAFHGSVFYDYFDDSLISDKLEGDAIDNGKFEETRYGAVLSGPIIPDTLFFMVGYEYMEGANIFDRGPGDSTAARQVLGVSQAQLDEIRRISIDVYDFDPGSILSSLPNEDEKVIARLDWNITDRHRAAFVYNWNEGFNNAQSDTNNDEIEFSSHLYKRGAELTSYSGQLFSDWTDNFSTELRLGWSELINLQQSRTNNGFGEVQIKTGFAGEEALVYLGQDDSRSANELDYRTTAGKIAGYYSWNNHTFTAGYELEAYDVFNLFVQEVNGEYQFDRGVGVDGNANIGFFELGEVDDIEYQNASGTNNPADAAAEFAYEIHTLFAQDEIFFDDLSLTVVAGLRYDYYTTGDEPNFNSSVLDRYGFDNTETLDGKGLLQPRLGFTFDASDTVAIHGGIGLFSGGNPNVWLSNNYSNNGITIIDTDEVDDVNIIDGSVVFVDPTTGDVIAPATPSRALFGVTEDQFNQVIAGGSDSGVNFLDPDFEIPGIWKLNIGATILFPNEYTLTLDAIFAENRNSAIVTIPNAFQIDTAPDGRPIYKVLEPQSAACQISFTDPGCTGRGRFGNTSDFLLTNVDGDSGGSRVFSAGLTKVHDFGLTWQLGYAYTQAEDVNPMTSAVAFSNYVNLATADPNNPGVATSNYEIPHRFTMRFDFERAFFGELFTTISLFGVAQQGAPFSFTFNDTGMFGDPLSFDPEADKRGLLYVPAEGVDPLVVYGPGFDLAAFNAFISQYGLDGFRGRIAERNAFNSSWNTRFDLRLEQEFPGLMRGHRSLAFVTIENLGNLLNDEWGIVREVGFPGTVPVVDADIVGGQYVFNEFLDPQVESRIGEPSQWKVRLGARYEF